MRVYALTAVSCCLVASSFFAYRPAVSASQPGEAHKVTLQPRPQAQPSRSEAPGLSPATMPADILAGRALERGTPAFDTDHRDRLSVYDRRFLEEAAMAGRAELVFAKLALRSARHTETRAFAQRMINDHMRANGELRTLAESKDMVLADELDATHQVAHQELSRLHGAAFDASYAQYQMRSLVTMTNVFRQATAQASDPLIKMWAVRTLPTLERHLQMARELVDGIKPVT